MREDGRGEVHVAGLEEFSVGDASELLDLIAQGNRLRTTQATESNDTSSRSHAICQVTLRRASGRLLGKLSLVDLAGSGEHRGCSFSGACLLNVLCSLQSEEHLHNLESWPVRNWHHRCSCRTARRSPVATAESCVDMIERGNDTKSHSRQLRTESAEINKSLLALKECIRGIASGSAHVPFRASKLTMVKAHNNSGGSLV